MSTKQLIVVGAGYTGARLLHTVLDTRPEWSCVATSRDREKLGELQERGVQTVSLDLLGELNEQLEVLAGYVHPSPWVVYSAPTLYRSYEPERHLEPLRKVMAWARAQQCRGLIYLSSTSVYGDHDGEWVDEQSARRPTSALGEMRRDLEDCVMTWPADEAPSVLYVARIVGIYGPGRTLADYIEKGRYKLVDGGEKITNRVHVDDLVSALLAMVERGEPGRRIYNVSDGEPVAVKELVELLMKEYGVPRPEACTLEAYAETRGENVAARWKNTYRCKNERLRTELGWQPQYDDARKGLRAIMAQRSGS